MEDSEDLEATEAGEEEYLEARIDNISITQMGFVIFLKYGEDPRAVPIFIGTNEAQSIALALSRQPPPRPMTHDLFKNVLEFLDCAVTRVEITDLKDNTFFAQIYLSKAEVEEMEFDARPSDAIALAIRWQAPIFINRRVFDEAAVAESATDSQAQPEEHETVPSPITTDSLLEQLQKALEKSVQEERYEEAARLRDELNKLQNGN
jgi:uncharacterized protein